MNKVGRPAKSRYNINDYIGKNVNKWKILGFSHLNNKGEQYWDVQCICGTLSKIRVYPLIKGISIGCRFCRPQSTPLKLPENWKEDISFSHQYYNSIMNGALIRNLEFSVSPSYLNELFINQKGYCKYSRLELLFAKRFKDFSGNASLDRIDNKKGYIEGNVQWIHKTINRMKLDLEEKEFLNFCKLITQNAT